MKRNAIIVKNLVLRARDQIMDFSENHTQSSFTCIHYPCILHDVVGKFRIFSTKSRKYVFESKVLRENFAGNFFSKLISFFSIRSLLYQFSLTFRFFFIRQNNYRSAYRNSQNYGRMQTV